MNMQRGIVYLVGAGPGDPGLITVRGRALLRRADVVIHDRLIGLGLLSETKPGAEVLDVGKRPGCCKTPQDEITQLMIDRARRGLRVVRLKGGDPFVFGRGFEEMAACHRAGVRCEVVPGISSALAAPAAAGIPLTLRHAARSFVVLTASHAGGDSDTLDFAGLAGAESLVILMGRAKLADICRDAIEAGRDPATPAACIEQATTPRQRVVAATLETLAEAADREGLAAPMVTVVGEVAARARKGGLQDAGPLAGKRIVVTRPARRARGLTAGLTAAGAEVICAPMIEIQYPPRGIETVESAVRTVEQCEEGPREEMIDGTQPSLAASCLALDDAIRHLDGYHWVIFTSAYGVAAFWRRLRASRRDARALSGCRIAAVGPATARALRRRGITADLVPKPYNAAGLIDALCGDPEVAGERMLYPCSAAARPDLVGALRRAGAVVTDVAAYRPAPAEPPEAVTSAIRAGVDLVVFCSPSAVRRYVELGLGGVNGFPREVNATVGRRMAAACIGPTTAEAARTAGFDVEVVAAQHTGRALVDAIVQTYSPAEVAV